jgi:hypothetical protein
MTVTWFLGFGYYSGGYFIKLPFQGEDVEGVNNPKALPLGEISCPFRAGLQGTCCSRVKCCIFIRGFPGKPDFFIPPGLKAQLNST